MKKSKGIVIYFISALAICLLVGCGGSSDSATALAPGNGGNTSPENNWNSLVWDQGQWQ